MTRSLDIEIGQRFGSLTVVAETRVPNTPAQIARGNTAGVRAAVCQCECGRQTTVRLFHLVHGYQRSCGCVRDLW